MQQALLKQRVGAAHSSWQYGKPAPHHDINTPRRGEGKKAVISFLAVLLLHTAAIALLITRTTEYTPLNLVNPAESVTIQAALVEEPEPEPVAEVTPEPPVLTSDQGEREIAPVVEQQPAPPEPLPPPVKREVKTPPKPQVKPRPVQPKTVTQPQPAARTERPSAPASTSPTTAAELAPGNSRGNMMENNPGAIPKNVASVGCAVPQPEYPRRARRLQQEGEVLIRLVIGPEGRLIRHEIARGSGYEALDQAAMSAVAQARCTPYRENGQAISVMTLQPVNFKLSR
ncbi:MULTISPECIES: energy transducer TonB [unclassified Brenneria]|uniref:energy transducer TonB n=1 Tax=unclassified Brenneria TaxID=2634434 RepID=UPI0029C5A659|nr:MULTISPECIES: energy transducer TonB [unclassified Brenneria]MDX5627939.1 energy transducer TonB [Brenneria sp. L3-3Z]MDX5694777.1 energy transducer TonB [Brenneria sp. L4-2C]